MASFFVGIKRSTSSPHAVELMGFTNADVVKLVDTLS